VSAYETFNHIPRPQIQPVLEDVCTAKTQFIIFNEKFQGKIATLKKEQMIFDNLLA